MIIKGKILPAVLITALFSIAWFVSCQSLNEEDLFGEKDCDTSIVTYSGDILPILEGYCYQCHSGSDPISGRSFEGYDNFYLYAIDRNRVYGAVNHLSGFFQMPKNRPKLPECELNQINKWIREGGQNN